MFDAHIISHGDIITRNIIVVKIHGLPDSALLVLLNVIIQVALRRERLQAPRDVAVIGFLASVDTQVSF